MQTDDYGLPLSTVSPAARDAYVEGCDKKRTSYPGAIEAFDRALAADPRFAVAHAAKAHSLLESGDRSGAVASIAAANQFSPGVTEREVSHIDYFGALVSGDSESALASLPPHLDRWPRDIMVLATAAFTNGLIGSSGRAGQKRMLLGLLEKLAPSYGDDWWFAAHHGMALSENGQRAAAGPRIERSLALNPKNPWAAHARAHLCYEEGEPDSGRRFLAAWLPTYPRDGALYSHLSWHRAMGELEMGDMATAYRLFRETFAPDVHSGPPRGQVNDGVAFLWRCELAGEPRDAASWRTMYELASNSFPRAGAAFSDMHAALAQIVAGDENAVESRIAEIGELVQNGRYPSGPLVPAASRGFAAFEQGDFTAAIGALAPVIGEIERIGGSRAQLDLIEFTLLKAYLGAHRPDDAQQMLKQRRRGSLKAPVAGLR
ncbi:MAG TPA: tetratricopeptide repeat protein [Stellaceae bacterium]|jgi:tetratricopeptide (TPR) repeat protein